MSYWCKISFKEINAEDIQEFFVDMKKKARERFEQSVEDNFVYSPFHKEVTFSDYKLFTPNQYHKEFADKQESWVNRVYTYRWFYLKEHHLLGVFGVGDELEDCFDATMEFQNSTDQDYEFEYWNGVKLFESIAEKYKTMRSAEIISMEPDWFGDKEEITEDQVDYVRKTLCYDEIWDTYLDDKLYEKDSSVFVSLFSPHYDDLSFVSKYGFKCYEKTIQDMEDFEEKYGKKDEVTNE